MNGQRSVSPLRIFLLAAGFLGTLAAALVLYFFDPETAGFYPVCGFHQLTGLQCPGCGSLRALHQLTHGNLSGAWRFNPLLVVLLPVGLWLALCLAANWMLGWRWPAIVTRPVFAWLLLIVTVVFGIARNLR